MWKNRQYYLKVVRYYEIDNKREKERERERKRKQKVAPSEATSLAEILFPLIKIISLLF